MFELDIMSANYILHWRMRRQKCVIMQEWVCVSVAIFMFKLDYEYIGCGSLIRKKCVIMQKCALLWQSLRKLID